MAQPLPISNDEVAAYHDLVEYFARRYDGFQAAEYDDLFQEGQLAVLVALQKGRLPSKDIIAFQMLKWVAKCARKGFTYTDPNEPPDVYVLREEEDGDEVLD